MGTLYNLRHLHCSFSLGDHQKEKRLDENSGFWFSAILVCDIRKFRRAKIKTQPFGFEPKSVFLGHGYIFLINWWFKQFLVLVCSKQNKVWNIHLSLHNEITFIVWVLLLPTSSRSTLFRLEMCFYIIFCGAFLSPSHAATTSGFLLPSPCLIYCSRTIAGAVHSMS